MDKKTILLVDDEIEFVTTLAQRLELRGFIPVVAPDGETALSFLAKHAVDVVLLDMMLPGINGLNVLQRIRAQSASLPVIMLTGNSGTKEGIEGMKLGANACLGKPVDFQELLDNISRFSSGDTYA